MLLTTSLSVVATKAPRNITSHVANDLTGEQTDDISPFYMVYDIAPTTTTMRQSTLCPKKVYPLIFDNNFGKYGPVFTILLRGDS